MLLLGFIPLRIGEIELCQVEHFNQTIEAILAIVVKENQKDDQH